MPPLWFVIFVWFCAGVVVANSVRRGNYVNVVGVLVMLLLITGIMAAIRFGFITDYPPR